MIKKIICPTDFSEESINATAYAAGIAKELKAELHLLNVQSVSVSSGVMLAGGLIQDLEEKSVEAKDLLQKTCVEIKTNYGIEAAYEVDVTSQSFIKLLSTVDARNTMIVMGAKSSRRLKDFFFGTDTYSAIKNTKCPLLFVPVNSLYKPFKKVVYAMAYEEKSRKTLDNFYEFIKHFEANITILHISNHASPLGKDVFRAEKKEIEEHFADKQKFHFDQLYHDDVAEALTTYVTKKPADLVVMAVKHRNVFETLFRKRPLVSELTSFPSFPVLVFHA